MKNKRNKLLQILVVVMLISCVLFGCKNEITVEDEISIVTEEISEEVPTEHEGYIKFQDRMSMDWGSDDALYLEKIAQYHGGDKYDRAYTIVVTLNRMLEKIEKQEMDCSILSVVLEELYNNDGITAYDFEGIVPDDTTKEAMKLVMVDKYDSTNGSLEYIEFYELED